MTADRDMDLDIRLSAYVDGELDATQTAAVERLLATDSRARARVAEFRETTGLLRAACAEDFYRGGLAHLLPATPARRAWRPRPAAMAIAASVLAAVLGFGGGAAWMGHAESPRDSLLSEVAEYHDVFSRETVHLVEFGPERAEQLFAWLGERLHRRVTAPDLRDEGLSFAGGRMLVVDGKPVAELMYTRASGRPVAFCITFADGATAPLRIDTRGHQRLASWQDGLHTFVLVGELDKDDTTRIAARIAEQI
jgi:anti-sigma factor RsiW